MLEAIGATGSVSLKLGHRDETPTPRDENHETKHSSEFKARIVLEPLRGLKTVQEIAAENDLHPVQVTKWKKGPLGSLMMERMRKPSAKGRRSRKPVWSAK